MTSFYLLTLQGSTALGSFLFGWIAEYQGVSKSIMLCGLLSMGGLLLIRKFPLGEKNMERAESGGSNK